jgi:TatD DNase family protein
MTDLADLITQARSSTNTNSTTPELVAFGEFGLDYDRLHYCSKEVQLHSFAAQLTLAASLTPQLPLFLHSRAAHADFVRLLQDAFGPRLERLERGGVVHSFTGTAEEMRELMGLGLYIGINGCSFKTVENCEVVREVRLDRLMIETDGPWCEVRPTHEGWRYLVEWEVKAKAEAEAAAAAAVAAAEAEAAAAATAEAEATATAAAADSTVAPGAEGEAGKPGRRQRQKKQPQQQQQGKKNQKKESEVPERYKAVKKEKWEEGAMVKGRNEPCTVERIAKIVAGIKGVSVEEVCEAAWANTVKVFGVDS